MGGAEIDAFDKNASARPPGTPGQSGGAVLIKAVNLTGNGDLRIDLTGQDGVTGTAGANGSPGPAGGDARGRGWQGTRGCGGGNEASSGGPGTQGKDGAPGGNGGNGGVVVVQVAGGNKDGALSRIFPLTDSWANSVDPDTTRAFLRSFLASLEKAARAGALSEWR